MQEIIKNLESGFYSSNTAGQAADDLAILSGTYARTCSEIEEVLSRKPAIWLVLRDKAKSDTSAERAWENSPEGIKEMQLRFRMKAIEKMMSSLKSIISVAQNELLRTK